VAPPVDERGTDAVTPVTVPKLVVYPAGLVALYGV